MKRRDPRYYQITVLGLLCSYGALALDFEVSAIHAFIILFVAQTSQFVFTKLVGLGHFDPKSALISSLSLILLLRSNDYWLIALGAFLSIASKFILRVNDKHFFNPTNFGIAAVLLLSDSAWISPGQWGSAALFGFTMACLGGLVVNRATRSDVTYAFLLFYGAILLGRSMWLGEPMTIPLHQLQSGAFLLFTFFMISDPKTTPNSRAGRILFALLVALGAGYVHFVLFRPNGLIWSLVCIAPLTPVLDKLLPASAYNWVSPKGPTNESNDNMPARSALTA